MRISDWSSDVCSSELGILPDCLDGIVGLYYFDSKSGFPSNRLSVLGGISNGEILGFPLGGLSDLFNAGSPIGDLVGGLRDLLHLPNAGIPNGVDVALHDQLGTKSWAAYRSEEHTSELQSPNAHLV